MPSIKIVLVYILFMSCSNLACQTDKKELSVMTYNIRFDNVKDGLDNWHNRKEALAKFVMKEAPHILGIQEGLKNQVDFLDSTLVNYKSVGVGRDDGISAGEHMSIYYRPESVALLDWKTYWLSPTPDMVSMGWDAACYRTCTVAEIVFGGDTINIINTHFDHKGETARLNSVKVIQDIISTLHYPVILMGDFNLVPSSSLYSLITKYIQDAADSEMGTSNNFSINPQNERRIDYVFYEEEHFIPTDYEVLMPKVKGRQMSDHYPVTASFKIK